MSESTPVKTKLQVSKGYLVQFDQLARVLAFVCADGRGRIPSQDIAEATGLATAQAQNLCSIAEALGLTETILLKPTALGKLVAARDPFFDDLGTLWFLHYTIGSDPRFLIWHRFANVIAVDGSTFTADDARGSFDDVKANLAEYSGARHTTNEIKVVLNAYMQQNFSRLAYLRENNDEYSLSYREPVAPLVLAAMIARFRDRHHAGATSIAIDELLTAPNSPGWVCQIPEDRFRNALEALKNESGFSLESRADLDQIRLTDATTETQWMERYYEQR